jgi:tRNA(Ile)-lysidine synthase
MFINKDLIKKQQSFLSTIHNTLIEFDLLNVGMSLLCAVSGGPDSVCLMAVCDYFSSLFGFSLGIAHVNHGIRGKNADQDADFVQNLAKKANLPFYLEQADVLTFQQKNKLCLEEAARELRYNALTNIAQTNNYQAVALGHHADDNSEQLIMNLIRGTGIKGLTGILPKRTMAINSTNDSYKQSILFIRPLIQVNRKAIMAFLNDMSLAYVEDESNLDKRFLRNRVRHELIPLLETYNPNIKKSLNRLADIQRTHMNWIDTVTHHLFQEVLIHKDKYQIVLNWSKLPHHHQALVSNLLRYAICQIKGNLRRITYDHIQKLSQWVFESKKSRYMNLPDHVAIHLKEDTIRIFLHEGRFSPEKAISFHYSIEKPGQITISERNAILQLDLKAKNFVNTKITNCQLDEFSSPHHNVLLDAEAVRFPITIRSIEPGDQFQPSGMTGHQKLKKFFNHHKIPISDRVKASVLISQDKIAWLIGYRIANFAAITNKTKKVLECTYKQMTIEH